MTEPRTIQMDMTWKIAAQIIAAALENGTGTGRDAARAELFRMADLLDELHSAQQADRKEASSAATLYEVITSNPESRQAAFGVTFTNEATATAYAERMEHHGYAADPFPAYSPEPSIAAALQSAANHFKDPRLIAGAEATE